MELVELRSEELSAVIDPGRGADVLSLVDRRTNTELLFSTPWRLRADAIRRGEAHPTSLGSAARWLEQYRGGWQTLCPNAGPERVDRGAPYGFHGEASTVPWTVKHRGAAALTTSVELFTAPVRIVRQVTVDGATLFQTDRITNLSRHDVRIDYSSHPAFGDGLLGRGAIISTDARTFVVDDEETQDGVVPGSRHSWPWLRTNDRPRDMRIVPPSPEVASLFGWLTDFDRGRVSIAAAAGITVHLLWDAKVLPFAWVWQELQSSSGFPWFGRARVMAIEPASTPTSGPGRAQSLEIAAGQSVRVEVTLNVQSIAAASEEEHPGHASTVGPATTVGTPTRNVGLGESDAH